MLGVSDGRSVIAAIGVSVSVLVTVSDSGDGVVERDGAVVGDAETSALASVTSATTVVCEVTVAVEPAAGVNGDGVTDGVSVGRTRIVGMAFGSAGGGSQAASVSRQMKIKIRHNVIMSYLPEQASAELSDQTIVELVREGSDGRNHFMGF